MSAEALAACVRALEGHVQRAERGCYGVFWSGGLIYDLNAIADTLQLLVLQMGGVRECDMQ